MKDNLHIFLFSQVVLQACTKRLRQEDPKFQASLGNLVSPCLKVKGLGR